MELEGLIKIELGEKIKIFEKEYEEEYKKNLLTYKI